MKEFLPVTEDELIDISGKGAPPSAPSAPSSPAKKSVPSPVGFSSLEKGRVDAAIANREIANAKTMAAQNMPYGHENNVVGKVSSLYASSADCTGAMSATAGTAYQTTATLSNPKAAAAAGYVQVSSNSQPGTWAVVRYTDSKGLQSGHAQMTMGGGQYFDSVPKVDNTHRSGPSFTGVSTESYLSSKGITPDSVTYLRPAQ